ncbi:MAG: regulatory protein RecX [Acidihalobacter sp.]|uniref:regulatory protein RecX n=1 Tax=Acidihalobacter sp. TaxID=1872108 RepID=UPI00307F60C8
MRSDSERTPRDVAIGLLARREHAQAELRAKLRGRGFSDTEIAHTLGELRAEGLQSDTRYAESYVRSRAERSYGPVRIGAELRQRGVDAACIERALAEYEGDWDEVARNYYRRHFGGAPPADFQERAKRLRHMQQRGFGVDNLRALADVDDAADD